MKSILLLIFLSVATKSMCQNIIPYGIYMPKHKGVSLRTTRLDCFVILYLDSTYQKSGFWGRNYYSSGKYFVSNDSLKFISYFQAKGQGKIDVNAEYNRDIDGTQLSIAFEFPQKNHCNLEVCLDATIIKLTTLTDTTIILKGVNVDSIYIKDFSIYPFVRLSTIPQKLPKGNSFSIIIHNPIGTQYSEKNGNEWKICANNKLSANNEVLKRISKKRAIRRMKKQIPSSTSEINYMLEVLQKSRIEK